MLDSFNWASLGPFIGLFVAALVFMARYVKDIHKTHLETIERMNKDFAQKLENKDREHLDHVKELKDEHRREIMELHRAHREYQERNVERLLDLSDKRSAEQQEVQIAQSELAATLSMFAESIKANTTMTERTMNAMQEILIRSKA